MQQREFEFYKNAGNFKIFNIFLTLFTCVVEAYI